MWKKRLLLQSLSVLLVLASSMTVSAEDRKASFTGRVTFDGKKMESNFNNTKINDEIISLQPGDSVELTVKLKNDYKGEVDWYMENEVLKTLEDSGKAEGGAYDYLLTYTDTKNKTRTLYASEKFGGEETRNGVGLKSATKTLENYIYLDRTPGGAEGTVKLKVALDGETLVNNYQNTLARLQMNFATEIPTDNGTPGGRNNGGNENSGGRREIIKTGDQSSILLFVLLMLGAGLVFLLAAIMRLRRDDEEEETDAHMRTGKAFVLILMFSLIFGQNAQAADEYDYTVRIYAGNQGLLGDGGITVPSAAKVKRSADQIIITGLKYGDIVNVRAQDAAEVKDEKYYVKGIRRSGRDNSEATEEAFTVASDRDYVIAYGIRGTMVKYTVNYVDDSGKKLLDSDTYYGNPGERQYVSYRYIDGYQPQAYNLVKTLSTDESKNVFDFRYMPVLEDREETPGTPAQPAGDTGGNAGNTGAAAPGGNAGTGNAAGGNETDAAGEAEGDGETEENDDGNTAGADEEGEGDAVGGDAVVPVQDEAVPQALQDLDEVEDPEVPLANVNNELSSKRMGYFPIYGGIAATAAAALIIMAFVLKKRQKSRSVAVRLLHNLKDKEK